MVERPSGGSSRSPARRAPAPNVRRAPASRNPVPTPVTPARAMHGRWLDALGRLPARRWVPLLAIVLGLGAFGYATFFGATDEELLRARLDALAGAIEVKPSEQNIVLRAARIKEAFSTIFVKDVAIAIPELTELRSGRKELVQVAAQAMTFYRTAWVDVGGLGLDVDKAGLSAVASGKVKLHATSHGGEAQLDERTVSLRFDKIEGKWLIVSVAVSTKGEEQGEAEPK
jgi:hypothetical protein